MRPEDILGCDLQDLMELFPHWQSGFDMFGRPIVYKQYGAKFDATKIKNMCSWDAIAKYHVWEQEACMRLCYEHSKRTGYIVETVTGVVDVGGLQLSQLSRDLLAIIKLVAEIDQAQYPETMGQTFVINTSSVFPVVWRMVKPWLDPTVAGKIHLLGGKDDWLPAFSNLIGLENVSSTYHGQMPALDPTGHPYEAIVRTAPREEDTANNDNLEASQQYGRIGSITRRMRLEETQYNTRLYTLGSQVLPHSVCGGVVPCDDAEEIVSITSDESSKPPCDELPLQYHPDSPYYQREGYYGSLTEPQSRDLESLEQWVLDEGIDTTDLALHSLHPHLILLRYLRANKWVVSKTKAHILRNLQWREDMDVKGLCAQVPDEILGCEIGDLVEVFPHWQSGVDKHGRPVLYKQYNNSMDASKILGMSSLEAVTRYHIWEQEACMKLCYESSKKTGYIVETVTAVIDVKGMQLYQVTRDFLGIIKAIADIDQNQYPETLGQTFIINTPAVFPLVWRGVKPWLDPVVAGKIKIFGPKEEEWITALDDYIGRPNMPSTYSGELPALNSDFHPYASILGDLPCGPNGKGYPILSSGNDSSSDDKTNSPPESVRVVPISPRNFSKMMSFQSADSSTVCTSAFGDAMETDTVGEYTGWERELDFFHSVVRDVEAGTSSAVRVSHSPTTSSYDSTSSISSVQRMIQLAESIPRRLVTSFGSAISRGYQLLLPKFLLRRSKDKLRRWLGYAVGIYMLLCLGCVGMAGYALSTMYWTSTTLVRMQMWSGVVVLCMSSLLALLNFAGFVGSHTSNRPLLAMYNSCLSCFFIVFLIIGVVCSIFSTNDPRVTGISNKAFEGVSGASSEGDVKAVLQRYNIILGAASAVLSICSLIPLMLSTCLTELLRREFEVEAKTKLSRFAIDRRMNEQMNQYRVVVRIAQVVSILIAFSMIGYGASALNFLLKIRFDFFVFAVYALLYSGVTVLLGSGVGIWSSFTKDSAIVRLYRYFVIPVALFVVVSTAIVNSVLLTYVPREVRSSYADLHIDHGDYSPEEIETLVQIELVVSAALAFSGGFFQLVCMSCAGGLYSLLVRRNEHCAMKSKMLHRKRVLALSGASFEELNKMDSWGYDEEMADVDEVEFEDLQSNRSTLSLREKLIICWSVLVGLIHIYLNGTYAMFAYRAGDGGTSRSWMLAIWKQMGKYDSRYVTADDFLISINSIMAVVVGPLLLVYAWSIVSRRSFRQVVGIIVNSLEIYSQVLYFAIEMQNRFENISVQNPTLFTLVLILYNLLRIIVPLFILVYEVNTVVESVRQSTIAAEEKKTADLLEIPYAANMNALDAVYSTSNPRTVKEDLNW
eukprot:CAMPEP_0185029586 /NCGR_PEP_ID=MMETSP1103-20130426/15977_1 /TAXON_ID=36769 /ORGANISM="Paraphysomonas bandaiensis, Strain Caron Lab Isolate" /LENGTH=1340 /DNA_ID=CAMNT_0027564389 /DNA_START=389 /DNA_END=4408 /DNA_ORIENTATION=+